MSVTDQHIPQWLREGHKCYLHEVQGRIHGVAAAAVKKSELTSTQNGKGSGCIG